MGRKGEGRGSENRKEKRKGENGEGGLEGKGEGREEKKERGERTIKERGEKRGKGRGENKKGKERGREGRRGWKKKGMEG